MRLSTPKIALVLSSLAVLAAAAAAVRADDKTFTGTVSNDFYANGNWTPAGAPGAADNALFLDPTKTATINFAGTRELGSFHLGTDGTTGGNVDFSGGTLEVHADFDRSHIGDRGAADSKFVMRGNATMLFDEPLAGGPGGAGLGSSGGNQDLEIGAQTGATGNLGLLELHDNAVLRISDDLKIGAETNGNGEVLIDGNAQISTGSGISVSESNPSKGKFTAAGNARVVSGNSAGAGNANQGVTDEGYFTLSVNADSTADALIKDSARVYARTLQMRGGVTNMTIQDTGEFDVFDTFNFPAPNLGVATIKGDPFGPQRASHVGQNTGSTFNLVVKNQGKFTIDSSMDGAAFQGLAVAGGDNRGALPGTGGTANIELRDNAQFIIQQNLHLTAASSLVPSGANSTLKIVGPNVDAQVRGNLYMSFDPNFQTQNMDPSTLLNVITSNTNAPLKVTGEANIQYGTLAVQLDGYSPIGGETYTLLTAGSIVSSLTQTVDLSLAPLGAGLSWEVNFGAKSVTLRVNGTTGRPGDFDRDGDVDGNDFIVWQRGLGSQFNPTNLLQWKANYGQTGAVGALGAVPEPATYALVAAVITALPATRKRRVQP